MLKTNLACTILEILQNISLKVFYNKNFLSKCKRAHLNLLTLVFLKILKRLISIVRARKIVTFKNYEASRSIPFIKYTISCNF